MPLQIMVYENNFPMVSASVLSCWLNGREQSPAVAIQTHSPHSTTVMYWAQSNKMRPKFFECSTVQNKNPDQKPRSETHTIQVSFRYYLAKSIFSIHAHIYYQKESHCNISHIPNCTLIQTSTLKKKYWEEFFTPADFNVNKLSLRQRTC